MRGLGRHWLWGNRQPEPLNLGVPVVCRHALLINVKPITAQEKFYFPRANAILARAQALLGYEIVRACEMTYSASRAFALETCNHILQNDAKRLAQDLLC